MGSSKLLRLDDLDQDTKVPSKELYQKQLEDLQETMLRIERAVFQQGQRVILAFEGCDAAGKGGAIRNMTATLDPRGFTVHPIGAPHAHEQGRHYLYRFWRRLPSPGQVTIFDRTWYGRVLVEKVEKLIEKDAVKRAYDEINDFERALIDDGVHVVKIYLHITKDEQLERFSERITNPYKRWKISSDDVRNRENWEDYVAASEKMFEKTSTKRAPWHLIAGNHKWQARLEVLQTVVSALKKHVDLKEPQADLEKLTQLAKQLGLKKILPLKVAPL